MNAGLPRPDRLVGGAAELWAGDCREVLEGLPAASVDAVVTDPPAGIGFMGENWDDPDTFPIRDRGALPGGRKPKQTPHKHGRGFANGVKFDKTRRGRDAFVGFLSGVLSECLRLTKPGGRLLCWSLPRTSHWTGWAVEEAGWEIENVVAHLFASGFPKGRSQLKPAREDWWLARKPGGRVEPLNIDAARVPLEADVPGYRVPGVGRMGYHGAEGGYEPANPHPDSARHNASGRWPANVVHDGSDEVLEAFAEFGERRSGHTEVLRRGGTTGAGLGYGSTATVTEVRGATFGDSGTAARFFFCAKASSAERPSAGDGTKHPTVKPLALCRWLVRLVAAPGETVLDPFAGSGTTGEAALAEGCGVVLVEREPRYVEMIRKRLARTTPSLFGGTRHQEDRP